MTWTLLALCVLAACAVLARHQFLVFVLGVAGGVLLFGGLHK